MLRNFMFVLCIFLLAACGEEEKTSSSDVIDKGLAAVAENDLGKAEGIFESAENNSTAQNYYEQIVLLREGQQLLEDGEDKKGQAKLNQAIDHEDGSQLIASLAKDTLAEHTEKEKTTEKKGEEPTAEENTSTPATTEQTKAQAAPKVTVISDSGSVMNYVQLANDKGNIRAQPSTDSQIVHSGQFGDMFIYMKEKATTTDGRTWYKVEFGSGSIGYVSQAVANLTTETPDYVRLTEQGTNVRSAPSLNASVIYTGNVNDTFSYSYDKTTTKDGRTWLHIWLPNGEYGYVSQKVATLTSVYIEPTPITYDTVEETVVIITAENANIRSSPSIDSSILYEGASQGTAFVYTGYSANTDDGRTWHEVIVDGQYGYISSKVGAIQ